MKDGLQRWGAGGYTGGLMQTRLPQEAEDSLGGCEETEGEGVEDASQFLLLVAGIYSTKQRPEGEAGKGNDFKLSILK